jgi:hypothetical protein
MKGEIPSKKLLRMSPRRSNLKRARRIHLVLNNRINKISVRPQMH